MKLIKNGIILTAETEFEGDILVDGEIIRAAGRNLDEPADHIIDASGKYIFPGGVDEHTHFGSFGGRLFETTEAAAAGGTTTIVDFAPQEKGDSLGTAIEKHAARAAGVFCVDFGFHSMVMDMQEDTAEQVKTLPAHGIAMALPDFEGAKYVCAPAFKTGSLYVGARGWQRDVFQNSGLWI